MLSKFNQKKRNHTSTVETLVSSKRIHGDEGTVRKELEEAGSEDEEVEDRLQYEDPFDEEFEEEEIIDGGMEEEEMEYGGVGSELPAIAEEEEEEEGTVPGVKRVWRPGFDELAEGEEMVYDSSAYVMYHSMKR